MSILDEWHVKVKEAFHSAHRENNPEINKLKEPVKVTFDERGQANSEQYFRQEYGLSHYAREANYVNTDVVRYKDDISKRYGASASSYSGTKVPNLSRGLGVGTTQTVNRAQTTHHSQQLSPMGKLGNAKPAGMAPIGMENNEAIKNSASNQNPTGASYSSGKLFRPY